VVIDRKYTADFRVKAKRGSWLLSDLVNSMIFSLKDIQYNMNSILYITGTLSLIFFTTFFLVVPSDESDNR
jgi:hypothetical protein